MLLEKLSKILSDTWFYGNGTINNIKNLSDADLQTYFDNVIDYKPIIKAIIFNRRLDLLQRVIIRDFDIRFENDILLIIAAHSSDIASVEYFINHGLDVTANDNFIIKQCKFSSEVLQLLIDNGADVNAGNGEPLIYCVKYSLLENIKVLIKNNADYRLRNHEALKNIVSSDILLLFIDVGFDFNIDNAGIFKTIARTFNYDLIKILLENGAEVKYFDSYDLRFFVNKISINANKIIQLLIDYGLDFNNTTLIDDEYDLLSNYIEPINIAYMIHDLRYCTEDNLSVPDSLGIFSTIFHPLEDNKTLVNNIKSLFDIGDFDSVKKYLDTDMENSALKTLIYNQELDLLKSLLNLYTDIVIDASFLSIAVMNQNIEAVKYLLDIGLDMNYNNAIAVLLACTINKEAEILELFIDHGLRVENKFLVAAAYSDNLKCIKILIDNGADMYCSNGLVLLYSTVTNNLFKFLGLNQDNCDTLAYYINCGLNVNYGEGMMLSAAIKQASYEKIKILLDNGADVSYINNVIDIIKCDNEIIKLLIEYGADFSTLNMYEVSETGKEFVALLLNNGIDKANICKIMNKKTI